MTKRKYNVGDIVEHNLYGKGMITKHDPNDTVFTYLITFEDSSKAWLANWQMDKEVIV